MTRRRTRVLIVCLWLGAAASAAPVLVMIGVEEVGVEELGFDGWRESGGLAAGEGEQGGLTIGGRERESKHIALMGARQERIYWEEKEEKKRDDDVELKWLGEKGERKLEIREKDERKQGDEGGGEEEGDMKVEGEQQSKMKEDEGGGRAETVDGGCGGEIDRRECRCTQYALSSGLSSAMMILSNLK